MFLLDRLLVGAPAAGFLFVLRAIADAAERELADGEDEVLADIRALHGRFESGEISESELRSEEAPLLRRWRAVRSRRREWR
jgi:hypothetical protein